MKRTKRNNKTGKAFIFVLIAAFAVSMGISYFFLKGKFEIDSSFIDEIVSRQVKPENKEKKADARRLYDPEEKAGRAGEDTESEAVSSLAVAEDIVKKHMKTYEVRLLDLYADKEGVLYIDLGDELKKNFKGDASGELKIVAELYKELELAVPGFKALKILIGGREAETIGGHIDISKPIGKEIAENI